jgi:hypothetical protein
MFFLLIPIAIVYFFNYWGAIYVLLGIVSLAVDWYLFYKPGFDKDYSKIFSIVDELCELPLQKKQEIANIYFEYMKNQIWAAQVQSVGFWLLISGRWLTMLYAPNYREVVMDGFIYTTFKDPTLEGTINLSVVT